MCWLAFCCFSAVVLHPRAHCVALHDQITSSCMWNAFLSRVIVRDLKARLSVYHMRHQHGRTLVVLDVDGCNDHFKVDITHTETV